MTLYADPCLRKAWRMNYGILKIEDAQDAHDFWERRGGVFPGCVMALAYAVEQIDADEALMRRALAELERPAPLDWIAVVDALRERLGADHA
jgi:hypothetical protein